MTTPDDERAHWDTLAGDPANVGGGSGMPGPEHYLRHLSEWYPASIGFRHCVDLGCGPGRILTPMADLFAGDWFAGVDISADMLAQIPGRENVSKHLGDGRTIPSDALAEVGGIDFAWSVLMFQHVPHVAQVGYIEQITDRLAHGGRFVLQWVDRGVEHDYSHPTPGPTMAQWAADAGLDMRAMWRDDLVPVWLWAVWERP